MDKVEADVNFFHHLHEVVAQNRDKKCLLLDDGSYWTYEQLFQCTFHFAGFLRSQGIQVNDRVVVQCEKCPEALALYLACLQMGTIYVPVNTSATATEIQYVVEDTEPKVLVLKDEPSSLTNYGIDCFVLSSSECEFVSQVRSHSAYSEIMIRSDADIAAILYTSGTTGRAKGAMLSHRNLRSNAETLLKTWGWERTDVLLHALPIYHVHGLFVAIHCVLLSGTSMWFFRTFDLEQIIRRMPHATVLMGVPTYYIRLLKEQGFSHKAFKAMRLFISGSAPLSEQTFNSFFDRTDKRILERYGMTETGMITSNPLKGERVAGSVGFPLDGVAVRIVDKEGNQSSSDWVGEIEVKGPNVFAGYWRMPEKTREEFTTDSYFKTGDMGYKNDEGRVFIVGREKDLVISGGLNVYPAEIETLIDEMEGVEENAIIGVPHPDFGEGVVVVVVSEEPITLDAVRDFLREKVASYKHPKAVISVGDLPKNAMGKVQKNLLRQSYSSLFEEN